MSLSPGDKLGPYEIVEAIGKGGMGAVYRARDTRLGRDVAIKVSDQKFGERFEREARVISSLNHPNICTLYDAGDNYLVMELVEGETLADRIRGGAIPLDESLAIARQIAAALEAAHEKGITHRDLKPGNVMLKPDGTVKVLDFGLAKVGPRTASGGNNPEESPTISMAATQAGVILGIAAYVAPEQARGKVVDNRADIWAFGVVLYEMVIGRRLFHGEDLTETLAAVVMKEPDLDAAPLPLRRLLAKCLVKDPAKRLRDIGDVWELLEEGREGPPPPARLPHKWLWPAIAALCAILTGALATWAPWRTEPLRPLIRLEVDLGADVSLPAPGNGNVLISPDGSRLAYRASTGNGPTRLFTRRLDQSKATELPGTDGAAQLFFSPDSQWIGFTVQNKLNKISVEGGAVVPLGDAGLSAGASWAEDGSIVVGQQIRGGMIRIPAAGGEPLKVTDLPSGEGVHAFPQILPGSQAALFAAYGALPPDVDRATIDVVTFADGVRKTLVRGGAMPHYLPSGHLIYVNKGTLFAIPFDPERLETRGTAVPILDDVKFNPQTSAADLSFSRDGTLVYRAGVAGAAASTTLSTIQWIDTAGKRSPLLATPGPYQTPKLSPDGKLLAMMLVGSGPQDVQVYDPQRDAMNKLTFGGGPYLAPIWSPDGRYVVMGGTGMTWTRADGAGQPKPLTDSKAIQVASSLSPDGKRLAYVAVGSGGAGAAQILTVSLEDEGGELKAGTPEQFLKSQFTDSAPEFSPDGRWIAYFTDESGRPEVNVRPFPPPASGQGGKWQISNNGGTQPKWSRTRQEILYRSGDQIMAVPYTVNGDSFVQEKPRVYLDKLGGTQWDLAPDGRIVVLTPVPVEGLQATPAADHTVVFLQNFFDELRRRVPVE